MRSSEQPIVILGAGINGAALARELVLNDVPVVLVDTADIASGTTAYSSRLIHGGLRYLEYGEFSLVRESLAERGRLLDLAPHYVRPLELQIPVRKRFGGWTAAALKFLLKRSSKPKDRGMWLVRTGLWMYDRYARDPHLPQHSVIPVGHAKAVQVNSDEYRWLCSYWDAQILYPERFVLAMLHDAREIAREAGVEFRVLPYHEARLTDGAVQIFPVGKADGAPVATLRPSAIVNATGAWVDRTLKKLQIENRRLIGGTKGTHFLTYHADLRKSLGGVGLYAEASDGRPVFVMPWQDGVLVGTTDTVYDDDPSNAVATDDELTYLLEVVNALLPHISLKRDDIHLHYAGIRPLPYSDAQTTGAITRRHWVEEHTQSEVPVFSVIGGKLTTCRSVAEETTATMLGRLGIPVATNSQQRPLPGAKGFSAEASASESPALAASSGLLGTKYKEIVESESPCLAGSRIPIALAKWIIEHEWVAGLQDLIERRLMLLYDPGLCQQTLEELAGLLLAAGKIEETQVALEVDEIVVRLKEHFGKSLASFEK